MCLLILSKSLPTSKGGIGLHTDPCFCTKQQSLSLKKNGGFAFLWGEQWNLFSSPVASHTSAFKTWPNRKRPLAYAGICAAANPPLGGRGAGFRSPICCRHMA